MSVCTTTSLMHDRTRNQITPLRLTHPVVCAIIQPSHIIPFPFNTTSVTTTPATSSKNTTQKHQHSHVLCLAFFFCRTSQECL
jgi:hypothetical protein